MRAVIQRVLSANVTVADAVVGQIERGLLVYLGIGQDDTSESAAWMLRKLLSVRIFTGDNGKLQHSVRDVSGSLLLVSQFTLYASLAKGKRPSFTQAMAPTEAALIFEDFCERARAEIAVQTGQFGADMQVSSVNDGPITLVLDSHNADR